MAGIFAAYNLHCYGSVFRSGYGKLGLFESFSLSYFPPRIKYYGLQILRTFSPLVPLAWLALVAERRTGSRDRALLITWFGAYLLLFPRANVLTLIVFGFFVRLVRIPAVFVLGFWFLVQFLSGLATWAVPRGEAAGGETAWFAHLGGFLTGMALLFVLRPRDPWARGPSRSW